MKMRTSSLVLSSHHVLAGVIDTGIELRIRFDQHAVARQRPVLLEVDVHRMAPAVVRVADDPDLLGFLRNGGIDAVLVEELPVDRPGAVAASNSPGAWSWPWRLVPAVR